jgi:hypothetical protein
MIDALSYVRLALGTPVPRRRGSGEANCVARDRFDPSDADDRSGLTGDLRTTKTSSTSAISTPALAGMAPSCLSVCHSRSGPGRRSREVFPPGSGCRVPDVAGSVVVGELALSAARHQAKDAEVQVAHDRAPPGPGTGSETTTASGNE